MARRSLAALILAAALLVRLVVPGGYMIDAERGHVAIAICTGFGAAETMADMPDMAIAVQAATDAADPHRPASHDHGTAEMPCAFAGLAAAVVAATDAVLLAGAIAFVLATGLARVRLPAPLAPLRLRPPPRGPPALG